MGVAKSQIHDTPLHLLYHHIRTGEIEDSAGSAARILRIPARAGREPKRARLLHGASLLGLCPAGRHPRVTGVTRATG